MWRNYLLIAWRNLQRQKLYSFLNTLGLSLALTSFIGIFLFVLDELSYDKYHSKYQRIYRIWEVIELEGQGEHSSSLQFPVGPTLKHEYPHLIEQQVRFYNGQQPYHTLQHQNDIYNEPGLFFVDTNVFEVFDYHFIKGNAENALANPNSIVLSKPLAQKFFQNQNPIGKELILEGGIKLNVTGVFQPLPKQTHMPVNALVSFSTLRQFMGNPVQGNNWVWNPCWTYLLLHPQVSPEAIESESKKFAQKYFPEFMAKQISFYLMPLSKIHLNSHLEYEIQPNGSKSTLVILSVIGVFILLIGCINFINLSIAQAQKRTKEIGVRKTMGGLQSQLMKQFLVESFLYSCFAAVISLAAIEALLPFFNQLTGKQFQYDFIYQPVTIGLVFTALLFTSFLSGFYPALYLSKLSPVKIFSQTHAAQGTAQWMKKALLMVQFSLSVGLIIATLVVQSQVEFMQNSHPGFNKQNILVIGNKPQVAQKFDAFRTELLQHESVVEVTRMNDVFGVGHNVHEYNYQGMPKGEWKYFPSLIVDENFLDCFELKLIAGRNFNEAIKTDDSLGVIINHAMAQQLGWSPQQAIGQQMYTPHGNERVIGVVKDFNYVSFAKPIQPFVLDMQKHGKFGTFFNKFTAVKFNQNQAHETINHIHETWKKFAPQFPLEYFMLSDKMANQYQAQNTLNKIIKIFTMLTIIITCIGLFALISFNLQQKRKALSLRKILGASSLQLWWILLKDWVMVLLPSLIISLPLTYYFLSVWLNGFAYRTSISGTTMLLGVLLIIVLSVITIGYHLLQLLKINIAQVLKYE